MRGPLKEGGPREPPCRHPRCKCWSHRRAPASLPIGSTCFNCGHELSPIPYDPAIFALGKSLGIKLSKRQASWLALAYGPNGGSSRALKGMARRELLRRSRLRQFSIVDGPECNGAVPDEPVYLNGPALVARL